MHLKLRWTNAFILLIILFFILAKACSHLYTDWLWFYNLNYQRVFATIILSDISLRAAAALTLFILLFLNLFLTKNQLAGASRSAIFTMEGDIHTVFPLPWWNFLNHKVLILSITLISAVMAFLFSFTVAGEWVTLQKFLHPTSFGVIDPVFKQDVSFYVFKLPFYELLCKVASWTVITIAFWVALAYFLINLLQGTPGRILNNIQARYHLSILAAVFFVIKAAEYYLNQYSLLFTHHGAVWGAGYTAVHATLLAYRALSFIALFCSLTILVNLFFKKFRLIIYSIGLLIAASVIMLGVYPALVQKFIVSPNEIAIERPYLERNIQFTRLAYNLDSIERKSFPAGRVLSAEDIKANQDTVSNIRLWDWEPLQQTYSQLQEMRLYYEFKDIDVDRYVVDNRYRQVMVAARELNQEHLPAQAKTWVNQRLKFTHGYGIAMSPVNESTTEGLPTFFLKDIPPVTSTDLKVVRPEIYYGEATDQYVIVSTKSQEFDYPKGDENVFCTYEGTGGVKIDNFFRRLIFAFSFNDYKLLLSGEIDNNSRILYYRNINQWVPKVAPFLQYDKDPYIVLSEGKLYWIWDAYTTTNNYPYSEPYDKENNYIRNSVKVVVDAYDGNIEFYIIDPQDPLVNTYSKIFPGVFKPLESMPPDLRSHIRYPVDFFKIQARMYAVYHMEDPQVFYNKEDKWNLPTEIFASEEKPMEPYYTIIKLPGENRPEFVLITPFTPQNKKNMIAWLAARSDGENYGRLLCYEFPKQELVYGPMQIEARINQDTVISQQISLWDQRGSRVIRGNLLVIPVKDALLYVEPLYLQAEQSKMPELRRVIVAHGDMVVMEPTLDKALEKIFGPEAVTKTAEKVSKREDIQASVPELAKRANQIYDEAQQKLKEGDWAGYGEALNKLKQTLIELQEKAYQ